MASGTKTASRKRATGGKRASSASKSRPRSQASRSKNSSSNRRSNGRRASTTKRRSSTSSRNGTTRLEDARKTVASTAQDAGHAVGDAASKAKVPLLAGSAALAGLAGGAAIASRGMRRRKVLGIPLPRRSVLKSSTKNLASAAENVGRAAGQMGELTSEVRRTRQAMDDGKRRSPIEVVLQGLTARRGQD